MNEILDLDPQLMHAIAAKSIREQALRWAGDRRFSELWARFFERESVP
jgi:hypothetical protein